MNIAGMGKKLLIATVLACCLSWVLALPVMAGLRVYGPKIEASVSPGSATTYAMRVENTSEAVMDISIEVRGYGDAQRGVNALMPEDDTSPYTARSFLSVSADNLHLEPGEGQDITIMATVPADVGNGGRYAIVYIRQQPLPGTGPSAVAAVAARVLLTIEGSELVKKGALSQVRLESSESGQPLEITAVLENTGNHHYHINAVGRILDEERRVVAESLPLVESLPLIPTYSRQITIPFGGNKTLPPGEYTVEIDILDVETSGGRGVILGREADVFDLEEPWEPPEMSKPNWALIGIVAGGVLLVATVIALIARKRERKQSPGE